MNTAAAAIFAMTGIKGLEAYALHRGVNGKPLAIGPVAVQVGVLGGRLVR